MIPASTRLARFIAAFAAATCLLFFSSVAVAGLAEELSSSSRSDADQARDAGRKPAEVIAFLGIEPGMQVMDVIAASGWYSEVLSIAVGPDGKVYAQNNDFVLKIRDGANDKALTARLKGGRLANVERVDAEIGELPVPDGSLDAALTALNFHDIYNGRGEEATLAFLAAVHAALKPGGLFGIIDHDGVAGLDNAKLHRMQKQQALDVIAKSGFAVEGESDLLANPADDHSQGVFTPGLRGNTDRFVLKLRKK